MAQSTHYGHVEPISLLNHTFSYAGFVLLAVNQYLCTFSCQELTNALLNESAEERK